jgi:hypothetical protein
MERRKQTIVSVTRSMLKAMSLPAEFWGEAAATTVFVMNMSLTRSLEEKTTYEGLYVRKCSVHYFHMFGCRAYPKETKPRLKKLDDRSHPMLIIGYEEGSKAYGLYDPMKKRLHVTTAAPPLSLFRVGPCRSRQQQRQRGRSNRLLQ